MSVVSIVLMAIGYIISTFMLGISSGIALSKYYLQNNLSESDDDCDENSYNRPKEITAKKTEASLESVGNPNPRLCRESY